MAIARHKTRQRELREARALIRRIQRGDPRAFELLYATYEGRIYRFCHRLTGRAETAAALVELTFARALANLPEGNLDTLDVSAHLHATARILAFERGGATLGSRGAAESEVSVANERLSPGERAVLALRDLEGRPDAEIAAALGVEETAVSGLVGAARLHLLAELRPSAAPEPCPGRLGGLSAFADGTLPAESLADLEAHVAGCSDCRAALFALREAILHYREIPVPEPPGELGSRITAALGVVGLSAQRAAADDPVATGGRQTAVAVAMAALAVVGVGVTIAAARDDDGSGRPAPPSPPAPAQGEAQPSAPASGSALASGVVAVANRVRRRPPTIHHLRAGPRRTAHLRVRRTPPSTASMLGLGKSYAPESPPAASAPPAATPPPATPVTTPKPEHRIPVQIVPPVTPSQAQAASDSPPPPPEPPPPPQTTTA